MQVSAMAARDFATVGGGGVWSEWVAFPCRRWLSTQAEDARISRILYAGHASALLPYSVVVHTSDVRGAGTDANVHLIMHGTLGSGLSHTLTSGPQDFERCAGRFVKCPDQVQVLVTSPDQ
jgi:hypothetical protein